MEVFCLLAIYCLIVCCCCLIKFMIGVLLRWVQLNKDRSLFKGAVVVEKNCLPNFSVLINPDH